MSHLRRRWTALLTAGALAMLALTTVGGGTSVAAACPATWTMQTADNPGTTSTVFQDVDSSSSTDAWAVGSYLSGGALRTLAEHYDGSAWTKFKTPNVTGSDNVLNDVVDLSPTDAWAVGWENAYYTLVEHWNGTSWSVVTSPSPGTQWSYLTAVDASNSTDVWAVGWQQSSPGLHTTLALHYQGSTWDVVPTPNTADPSDNLSAVAAIAPNDVWAGGYTSATTGTQTLLMHWDGTAWTIVPSPNLVGGNNTITDLAAVSSTDVWAVGYAVSGNKTFGLTLHWDGTTWSMVSTPAPQSLTMLRGVAAVSSTNVWAVGLTYDPTLGDYNSLTENWNGTQWTVVPAASATGENYLTGATAAPSTGDLWAVGWDPVKKMPLNSLVEARCGTPAAAARLPAGHASPMGTNAPSTAPAAPAVPAAHAPTRTVAHHVVSRKGRAQNVVAVDMAGPAGVAEMTSTFGGAVADFNNDGWPDVFEGHHYQSQSKLLRNDQGVFTRIDKGQFPGYPDDRHDCVWLDVNRDGLLDLFCVQGGERGTIVHHDDLLLQKTNHTFTSSAGTWAALDPYGKGVHVATLDVNRDGNLDLFLSNDTTRQDGMPGTNRLLLAGGGPKKGFSDAPSLGLDTEVSHSSIGAGNGCAEGGDFTGDGWPDLMVCGGYSQGILLYQNNGGTSFTDVSAQMGAPGGKVISAVLADMNGDGVLDLVYIYNSQVKVALQNNGVFQTSFTTSSGLTNAYNLAVGDVNGDGAPDIYVVQGGVDNTNAPDALFVNDGTGTSFTSLSIPETTEGAGDDVVALDYDKNGLTDFFVFNGWHDNFGPIQLIAFFPAGSAQLRRARRQTAAWAASRGPGNIPVEPTPIAHSSD